MSETALAITPIDPAAADLRAALSAARLPVDDLAEPGRHFHRFDDDGGTIGFGGLELHGTVALLRSVVVLPERRGQGHGQAVVSALRTEASRLGVSELYLLTKGAAPFFERLGFARVDRAEAPAAIRQSRQAQHLCPASASLLVNRMKA
ncbi:arsenic resistance N-acetyltransferase ArsN2 [Rhizobium sp. YIM 134829]|uniref:arsenic resistance N-acetyltransferase ArsN2 n=1 Tax=Rhizobium sp. YIM 134829 TaxID=3390453 RepID=UPI00397B633E